MGVGDPVVATGRLRISQWRRGEERLVSAEIDVQAIGHDLRWGTSAYRRGGFQPRVGLASSVRAEVSADLASEAEEGVGGELAVSGAFEQQESAVAA